MTLTDKQKRIILVSQLAKGEKTAGQIARECGCNTEYVRQILRKHDVKFKTFENKYKPKRGYKSNKTKNKFEKDDCFSEISQQWLNKRWV